MYTATIDTWVKEAKSVFDDIIPTGQSKESDIIKENAGYTLYCFEAPISRITLEKKFDVLVSTWSYNTAVSSSVREMVLDPSYQEIIGMGELAIPLILRELQKKPDHWFWALRSITGIDPVKEEDKGDVRKMTAIWLRWGQDNGYIN